ncbi:MAG: toll/interleukin-1 receptor domain-containing protein [Chlorobi bacterium]|nr:toll/interleukin-1 receptor domain-containing protein [Chlorobiota bacterium]
MTYSLYIKTYSTTFNILNINKNDLDKIINAFNIGKRDFFIGGEKYWIKNLFEIRIFAFKSSEEFKRFFNHVKTNNLYTNSIFSGKYIEPKVLRKGGKEVTREFIKGDFGYLTDVKNRKTLKNKMEIFISHSSADIDIAKLVIEIIRKAFNIESKKIRCTSVPGHKLPAGASTNEQLKEEIFSSKAFIGLITKVSVSSTYVLFELGARWGVNLPLIPLICDKGGTSLLNGPIKNINALSAIDSSDMLQFLNDLGDILNSKPEDPSGYIGDIEKLKKLIIGSSVQSTNTVQLSVSYNDSDEIIKKQSEIEWPDNYEMQVSYINDQREAVKKLQKGKPTDLTDEEFDRIRARAEKEWPLNFEMRLDEEERQIESLRKLKNI